MSARGCQIASLLVVLILCGCGGGSKASVTEGPTTAETGSTETARNPTVEDLTAVRTAFDTGQADEALMGMNDLFQQADGQEGAETLRHELPGLVAQLNAAAPAVLARLSALELQTDGGRRFRDVVMKLLRAQTRLFNNLNEDVAAGEPTREAMVQWEDESKALSDRLKPKLEALVNGLPPEQRVAVREAVYKFFAR